MNIHSIWSIPLTVLYYIGFTKLSHLSNTQSAKYMLYLYIYGALCPMWVLVTKVSNNLLLDGLLYDTIMVLTFAVTLCALGYTSAFNALHWLGLILVIIGIILMKL